MEAVSNANLRSEDSEPFQISAFCLCIPLVLRKIMRHFSNAELIKCSLVSKQWNYEARSILKTRRCIVANLKTSQPCRKLDDFVSDVRQMNIVPYSGMILEWDDQDSYDHFRTPHAIPKWDPTWDVALDHLRWKHLSVCICVQQHFCSMLNGCPITLLMKKVLRKYSGTLEELSLKLPQSKLDEFFQEILQDSNFPRLKSLRLQVYPYPSKGLTDSERVFIKALVSRAPKLKELFLDQQFNLKENVLEGSSAFLSVDYEMDPMYAQICKGLISVLRLEKMQLKFKKNSFNMERFDRIVPEVLRTSRTALRSLRLNIAFLPSLMQYRICLENVTELRIDMNFRQLVYFQPSMLKFVNVFDFARIFPRLDCVGIEPSPGMKNSHKKLREIMELGNTIGVAPNFGRSASIKHLMLCLPTVPPVLALIFPKIEQMTVVHKRWPEFPYGLIKEHWPELKELRVHVQG